MPAEPPAHCPPGASCTGRSGTPGLPDPCRNARQTPWLCIYPFTAELMENRYLRETKAYFFSKKKKNLYLHMTAKSKQHSLEAFAEQSCC